MMAEIIARIIIAISIVVNVIDMDIYDFRNVTRFYCF